MLFRSKWNWNRFSAQKDFHETYFISFFFLFLSRLFVLNLWRQESEGKQKRKKKKATARGSESDCHICVILFCNLHLIYCELWMRWIHNKLDDIGAWLCCYIAHKLTCYSSSNMELVILLQTSLTNVQSPEFGILTAFTTWNSANWWILHEFV